MLDGFDVTPEQRDQLIYRLFRRTKGRGWSPPDPNHPIIQDLVQMKYIRRTDGRCSWDWKPRPTVVWTFYGRKAMSSVSSQPRR